jgi:hypothetical protein
VKHPTSRRSISRVEYHSINKNYLVCIIAFADFHEKIANQIILVLGILNQQFNGQRINFFLWIGDVVYTKLLVREVAGRV